MAEKISCPKIQGIYCLDYFWDDMKDYQQKTLSENLASRYENYKQEHKSNQIINTEPDNAISICPGKHNGADIRLVSIKDPRKNTKDNIVCLFFPVEHNSGYNAALEEASGVYDAFRKQPAPQLISEEEYKNHVSSIGKNDKRLRLVVVRFYYEIFQEDSGTSEQIRLESERLNEQRRQEEQEKLKKQEIKKQELKDLNRRNAETLVEDMITWYNVYYDSRELLYDQIFKDSFAFYPGGWESYAKEILNKTNDAMSEFLTSQILRWEMVKILTNTNNPGTDLE